MPLFTQKLAYIVKFLNVKFVNPGLKLRLLIGFKFEIKIHMKNVYKSILKNHCTRNVNTDTKACTNIYRKDSKLQKS